MTMYLEATLVGAERRAPVEEWVLDADMTHYRLLVVRTSLVDPQGLYAPTVYLMVEPAAGRRVWFPMNDPDEVYESYVAEKTRSQGADAKNLTTLIAAALGVPARRPPPAQL